MYFPIRLNFEMSDHIRMVPVDEILSKWDHSDYPYCTWDETLASKRNDLQYPELRESILNYGLNNPVYEWVTTPGFYNPTIGNGHHRLAVLIEAGCSHIPVSNDSDTEWSDDWPDEN